MFLLNHNYLVYRSQCYKGNVSLARWIISEISAAVNSTRSFWLALYLLATNLRWEFTRNFLNRKTLSWPLVSDEALRKNWYLTFLSNKIYLWKITTEFVFKFIKWLVLPKLASGDFFLKRETFTPISQKSHHGILWHGTVYQ